MFPPLMKALWKLEHEDEKLLLETVAMAGDGVEVGVI